MKIARILAELKAERRRLNRAIAALEKLAFAEQREKRSALTTPAPRRAHKRTTLPPKEKLGRVILFRKLRKISRSKGSQAEEA